MTMLNFLRDNQLVLYILPPDTTGVTQHLDQVNQKIHSAYCTTKDDLFTPFSTINKEGFMKILGNAWEKWISPEGLRNAAKRVGITENGLNVDWMDQEKFIAAASLLQGSQTPQKSNHNSSGTLLESPVGVRKGTAAYYKYKLDQSMEKIKELNNTVPDLEEIPDLLSFKQIKPKVQTTTKHKVTHVHGSMRANDIIQAAEKIADDKKQKEEKNQALLAKREKTKEAFYRCKQKCVCEKDGKCIAFDFKECSVCHNILKSQCGKQSCRDAAGQKPNMLIVDAAKKQINEKQIDEECTDEEMDIIDESSENDDTDSDEDTESKSLLAAKLRKLWKSLSPPNKEENIVGNWYGVIYKQRKKQTLFIAKLLNRFLHEEDGPVHLLRMKCLKPKCGSGNTLDDTPKHLPEDIDNFSLFDIIAGPLCVTPKGSTQFEVTNYEDIVTNFNEAIKVDRESIFS